MPNVLDRDAEAPSRAIGRATVALHTHEGMIREGRVVDVKVSEGTASRAFPTAEFVGWIRVAQFVDINVYGEEVGADTGRAVEGLLERQLATAVAAGGRAGMDEAAGMAAIARAVAAQRPAVAVERPQLPRLGDEPVENIRRLFGLTYGDFGRLFGISERHVHRWQRSGVPEERRHLVDGLQAVGLTVVGGLGPAGARAWLRAGDPSGETLVQAGRIADLAARADAGRDSVFT
jgi:DNA-binding transcriptional regulator YiaG